MTGYASQIADRRTASTSPYPFETDYISGDGLTFAATTASASQLVAQRGNQLVISNVGDNWAHVRWGDAAVVATTASQAIPPGSQLVFSLGTFDLPALYVAARSAASTTTLQVSRGWGV